jgi:hypothetical protein
MGNIRLAGRRGEALNRFWAGKTDAAHALAEMRGHVPAPLPSEILLGLCADLVEAASDLGQQSRAALDREEVLVKLNGISERVAVARAMYLAAIDGRS